MLAHAGGGRAIVQFLVDRVALRFGRLQQALHFRRDFGLQMVLQHGAFLRREQLAALGDLFGEPLRKGGPAVQPDSDR